MNSDDDDDDGKETKDALVKKNRTKQQKTKMRSEMLVTSRPTPFVIVSDVRSIPYSWTAGIDYERSLKWDPCLI